MSLQTVLIDIAFFLFTALVVLVVSGNLKKSKLKSKNPPVGKMVDIGGYRLHIDCQGEGGPTVVFDAGQGESGLSWSPIQQEIARNTRVCVYDRAGIGWSEPGTRPRTARVMVEELHILLEKGGIPKPYVLVGASLGGLNARLYAHLYPEEVAGLVLLDAAHEEQYLPEAVQKALKQMSGLMSLMAVYAVLMVRSGLAALFPRLIPGGSISPAGSIDQVLRVSNASYMQAAVAEIKDVEHSHAEVREMEVASLGHIPIIVIRHGKVQEQMMPDVTQVMEETNERLQSKVAQQSENARLIVAEESGHAIQMDQPKLVVQAIMEVVEAVRAARPYRPSMVGFPNGSKKIVPVQEEG